MEDMPAEELITRAIQAFEYVEPYQHTEAGKPLFSRVLRMLAGSNNNSSMPAHWSPEAVNQFAEYYKDSKYQDYKFTFAARAPGSLRLIDVTSKELPGLLGEDDLSWLPWGVVSHEGESMYAADYTPEFTDKNVEAYFKTYPISAELLNSASMPSSSINPPMLSASNQQDVSSGMSLSTIGTIAAVAGVVFLAARKFGFFRDAAPEANQQQVNAPGNDVQVPLRGPAAFH